MRKYFLLDSNVLIALTHPEHVHARAADAWFQQADLVGLCPIAEGALVRFMVREGEGAWTAARTLADLHGHPKVAFWPDAVSYVDCGLEHIHGHQQVTDAYLCSLARANEARLATFDRALAEAVPDVAALIPTG